MGNLSPAPTLTVVYVLTQSYTGNFLESKHMLKSMGAQTALLKLSGYSRTFYLRLQTTPWLLQPVNFTLHS